jgi:hypothetical protein
MKVIVHPGQLKTDMYMPFERHSELYGDYGNYLRDLKHNALRRDITITSPEAYNPNCRKLTCMLPFKVAENSNLIVDHVQSIHWQDGRKFEGAAKLLRLLEKKKVGKEEEIGLCGERLWYLDRIIINNVQHPPQLLLGDVPRYYNTLFKAGYNPKIIRNLCYPTKDPPGFTGTF